MTVEPLVRNDESNFCSFYFPSQDMEGLETDDEVGVVSTIRPAFAEVDLVLVDVHPHQRLSAVKVLHPLLTCHRVPAIASQVHRTTQVSEPLHI
jgi:hypothetical protein